MFCTHCGKEIDNNTVICPHCGVPANAAKNNAKALTETNAEKNPIAYISLAGALVCVLSWIFFTVCIFTYGSMVTVTGLSTIISGLAGLFCGIYGICKKASTQEKQCSLAGLILSAIFIFGLLLVCVI